MFRPGIEIQFGVGKSTDWLNTNLREFVKSLDAEFRRRKQGKVKGKFERGFFIVTVRNSSVEVIRPYLDAFVRRMREHGERLIVSVKVS